MQCLLTALKAESQPLIDNFDLKKDLSFPFPVFKRDDLYLIEIGMGKRKIKERIDEIGREHV